MSLERELAGFINSGGGPSGFVLPVFRERDQYSIQEPSGDGTIREFVSVDVHADELLPPPQGRHSVRLGQPLLLAFRFPDGQVVAAERERLQLLLMGRAADLKPAPFARVDALVFAGAIDAARRAIGGIYSRLAIGNREQAERWASSELKYLQSTIVAVGEHRRIPASTVFLFPEGFVSWPTLYRHLSWAAERECEMQLSLRLVRSSPTARSDELLGTFGLNPERIGSESELRFSSGSYRRFLEVSDLVMIIGARLRTETIVEITAINPNSIMKKYFKKSHRKRALGELSPDYRYIALDT